jgi:hypothetical protein
LHKHKRYEDGNKDQFHLRHKYLLKDIRTR